MWRAALPRSRVPLHEIFQVESFLVSPTNILARLLRPVFYNDDLKILHRLPAKTLKQFVNFVRTIENRNDDGIFHRGVFE